VSAHSANSQKVCTHHRLLLIPPVYVRMSRVTSMNESCHIYMHTPYHRYAWVTPHTWMSHVTHMNESRSANSHTVCTHSIYDMTCSCTYRLLMFLTPPACARTSHVINMKESCHTSAWVMHESLPICMYVCMSHVTRLNESRHAYEWAMLISWMSHVVNMSESCHAYELAT